MSGDLAAKRAFVAEIQHIVKDCIRQMGMNPPSDPCPAPEACPAGSPNLKISKTITTPGPYRIGQTVESRTVVCNTGSAIAENVMVNDTVFDLSAPSFNLQPGQCEDFTASVVLTSMNVNGRMLSSTSTATYRDNQILRTVDASHQLSVEPIDPPCIQLTYKKDVSQLSEPPVEGETIRIVTCIRNDGTSPATVVLASQPDREIHVDGGVTDATSVVSTYALTQDDIDRNMIMLNDSAFAYGEGGKSSATANCEICLDAPIRDIPLTPTQTTEVEQLIQNCLQNAPDWLNDMIDNATVGKT